MEISGGLLRVRMPVHGEVDEGRRFYQGFGPRKIRFLQGMDRNRFLNQSLHGKNNKTKTRIIIMISSASTVILI